MTYQEKFIKMRRNDLLMFETGHTIAVMKTVLYGKERDIMVAYRHEDKDVKLLTIYPLKEGQKEKRIQSGRWRKLYEMILKSFTMNPFIKGELPNADTSIAEIKKEETKCPLLFIMGILPYFILIHSAARRHRCWSFLLFRNLSYHRLRGK